MVWLLYSGRSTRMMGNLIRAVALASVALTTPAAAADAVKAAGASQMLSPETPAPETGANVPLTALRERINGVCGSANRSTLYAKPQTSLCTGAPSAVSLSAPWTWTCAGAYGGSTAKCSTASVSYPISDSSASSTVSYSSFEPRPGNTTFNNTVPTSTQLTQIQSLSYIESSGNAMLHSATGNFTGTTDEILQ